MKIFNLPDLGEGLAEAEVRQWYVKAGDEVKVDQPLVSMETAKAVVDVPSPYAGKIVELFGKENQIVKTGAPLVSFQTKDAEADKGSVVGKLETSEKKWDDGDVIVGTPQTKSVTIKAMPAARVLAKELGVDLNTVTASGPQGLITPDDVRRTTNVPLAGHEPLKGVRRVMAQAMMHSHQEIVPVTIIEDADISNLPAKTDVTVILVQAIVQGIKTEPALNAWFDGKSLGLKLHKEVNVGMAVDTPEGLFVPVIKQAESKSSEELRKIIDTYKETVKARTIAQTDMQGATITLSNFGMIAGLHATPIIVPPAVAILGVGRSREVPVVRHGQVVVGKILPLSLTFDHRAVTGRGDQIFRGGD